MERLEVLSLVIEAQTAADPKYSGLSDYRDLQHLLRRLSQATQELLQEVEERDGRLHRTMSLTPVEHEHHLGQRNDRNIHRSRGKHHLA